MTKECLYNFIRQNKFSVLATVTQDNLPESACVGIAVTEELELIFDTLSDSRKYKNLIYNQHVSFVIGWENGQTIQYEGTAKEIDKKDLNSKLKIYFKEFPDGVERRANSKNVTYFNVVPKWIRYSDFNELPPKIEEITF